MLADDTTKYSSQHGYRPSMDANSSPPRSSSLESNGQPHSLSMSSAYYQKEVTPSTSKLFKKMSQPWQRKQSLQRQTSMDSLQSNVSTTSSIMSTASKISKLPQVMKTSVKGLLTKSISTSRRLTHSPPPSTSSYPVSTSSTSYATDTPSFSYRLRKRTPSALGLTQLFNRRRTSIDNLNLATTSASPATVTKPSNPSGSQPFAQPAPVSSHHTLSVREKQPCPAPLSEDYQENDLPRKFMRLQVAMDQPPQTNQVGNLLFGQEITTFFDASNPDSTRATRQQQDLEPIGVTQQKQPFHMFLVTATLTSLRTKLLADCDRTLANALQPDAPYPSDTLKTILQDLRKMADMVTTPYPYTEQWSVLQQFIDQQAPVRDITNLMRQMVHQQVSDYYRVHEKAMVIPCKGYKIEGVNKIGSDDQPSTENDMDTDPTTDQPVTIEHMDEDALWFRQHFMDQTFSTFCGFDSHGGPVLITALYDSECLAYRVITRVKQSPDYRELVQDSFLLNAPASGSPTTPSSAPLLASSYSSSSSSTEATPVAMLDGKAMILDTTWKAVLESTSAMANMDAPFHQLKKIAHDDMVSLGLREDLLRLDENGIHDHYKIGVLLIKDGQAKEEEWFANKNDSPDFDEFLSIIGQRQALLGYQGWAAGLDTKTGDSGEHIYVTNWQKHDIAYHVAPLIPLRQGDRQQIQRKRHIGNDIVCLVFVQGCQPFNPAAIKSQFLHVFIVVHKEQRQGKDAWRVEITSVEHVPAFGPPLPQHGLFFDKHQLRSFLLAKMINAEYAGLKSPKFASPLARAREGILANIVDRGFKLAQDTSIRTGSMHSKSASTASDRSVRSNPQPTPSRSMKKELSNGVVMLTRRRSTQDALDQRPKTRQSRKKEKAGAKQYRSESELLTRKIEQTVDPESNDLLEDSPSKRDGFKQRAHGIFTSFSNK